MISPDSGIAAAHGLSEALPKFEVILAYEDLATGLRAMRAFDHVVHQLDMEADFRVNVWKFDLLLELAKHERVGNEAADADILMLAAHGQRELPGAVNAWLKLWLDLKKDRPAALVVSLDAGAKDSAGGNQILNRLRPLAAQAGVDVFSHFSGTPGSELNLALEKIRARADTTSTVLEGILHRHESYPHWGINE